MARRAMRPARGSRLVWLPPDGAGGEPFEATRVHLERIAATPRRDPVYTAKRRSIYRVADSALGPVALKEIRNANPLRRVRFGHFEEHRTLREFRLGVAFEARGGHTPHVLGAALERGRLGLRRVFLFARWLDGAQTLTQHLARCGDAPAESLLEQVARFLVDCAREGLVHGRHSSENILVVPARGGIELYAIDFAYARLAEGFDADGFVADAARVARRLLLEQVVSRATLNRLFHLAARAAWGEARQATEGRARLEREFERILCTARGL